MDPFLIDVARRLDAIRDPKEIEILLDKLEFLYDALDAEQQELASRFIATLTERLSEHR